MAQCRQLKKQFSVLCSQIQIVMAREHVARRPLHLNRLVGKAMWYSSVN